MSLFNNHTSFTVTYCYYTNRKSLNNVQHSCIRQSSRACLKQCKVTSPHTDLRGHSQICMGPLGYFLCGSMPIQYCPGGFKVVLPKVRSGPHWWRMGIWQLGHDIQQEMFKVHVMMPPLHFYLMLIKHNVTWCQFSKSEI